MGDVWRFETVVKYYIVSLKEFTMYMYSVGFNGIQTHDICDTGTVCCQLICQAN